ncbi:NAD-dependent epimerase/dehydratase family protein [Halopiger xanaduensis]|uniref:NAD-dependent epimerase/dehydratase n=1 Tax=Halopiger xanaduensis (strain DSM 18323 / JCM 14033 / SH-6) TaxID=797210 RepID=F8D9E1_HALXS|nr:NAD-dependent epimerase/dehydratase family protein [Halopiger xanaduensis]AEH36882.1 NAD-dependent epimerase/dehydratase [Halopiger xanaduensis SH-6]
MRVLCIGGTGVISTGITRQLVDAGHEVVCFTRGETDAPVPDAVEFVTGDRNDRAALERAAREADPDCVVDMVCFTPEQASEAVDAFGGAIEQYVFCSTVDVYHRPLERNPATEDAPRESDLEGVEPVSEYGADKAAAEDVFLAAHDGPESVTGTDSDGEFATTIVRPWSTYGEGGSVFHTFGSGTYYLDRIRKGKPIVVHGDGTSLWGSCHRDDVARAFVGAVGNETAYGEAYHVTSEEVITWNQYHQRVANAMDAPDPELVHIPTEQLREAAPDRTDMLKAHFQYSTVFDNAKARRDLGFEYTIDFEEGMRRTIADLEARDAIDPWDSANDDEIIEAWDTAIGKFLEHIGS